MKSILARSTLAFLFALAAGCGGDLASTEQPDSGTTGAGADGGAALGSVDAGTLDAGSGSGSPDAGAIDGGTPDSGEGPPLDAGTRDAGPEDGGHVVDWDAGAIDAGAPIPFVLDGGTLASLDFGVVGDTRPPFYDDTANYPTQVITTIFQDLAQVSPPVAFVAATGDYMFASPFFGQASPQAKLFVGAAQSFSGPVFPAMGNHECDFATSSDNCSGQQTSNPNFAAYLGDILGGLGLPVDSAYFAVRYASSDPTNPWTAKFVYMAANAWDDGQDGWLGQILAVPTTYTFLLRHEPTSDSGGAPGVAPSDTYLQTLPFTLKLTGHSHSYSYDLPNREVVNGLAGAPLNSGYTGTYGYVVCRQRTDGAIQCALHDYDSNAVSSQSNATIAVMPDGSSTAVQ
ncbi:MAG: metallophosphoesterase [Deltaproteobacteria bacterium]